VAQDTFGQIWNRVLLYAPGTPVPLVQQFVKNAYQRAIDMHYWSDLIKEGQRVVGAEYSTGTVALTSGSATATISGGAWTGLTNRTVRFADLPDTYTITAVSGGSDEVATLDRTYDGATDTDATFLVADFYIEFPSDLSVLDDIRDIGQNWRLRRQFHQQPYLDLVDAERSTAGTPCMYVAAPPRITAGVTYPRYEFWPRPSEGTNLVFRYYASTELSTNSSYIIPGLKPEAVVFGALSELALWPGSPEKPNTFFSIDIHKQYVKLFEDAVHDSEMADLDKSQRMLMYDDTNQGVPLDANWLQSHGIPL
jgi:hypothetical protein